MNSLDHHRITELLRLLRRRYPAWEGFADRRFQEDELAAKHAEAAKARDLLGYAGLQGLLARGDHDAFIDRLRKLGGTSPLLYKGAPRHGDLGILYHDALDPRSFCEEMLALLYGSDPSPARLERYVAYIESRGLPNRWTFPTYFLSICHPESEMFVQPGTMRWALQFFGLGSLWRRTPNPRTYSALIRLGALLKEALHEFGPRNMIDIQSAIWTASRQADMGRYWKISPGENAWQWDECRRGNFIGVGWELFGDISRMSRAEFDARHREILRSFPELRKDPDWSKSAVAQLWSFAHIPPGDVIVANRGTTEIVGTGRVVGPYYFVPAQRNGHRLPVLWRDTPREVHEEGWRRTLLPLDEERFAMLDTVPPPIVAEPPAGYDSAPRMEPLPDEDPITSREPQPEYPLELFAEETGFDVETLMRWVRAIDRKGQAILYGPPGTGKTFMAEHLARHMAGGGDGLVRLVQLHPAYAYEDFVIGIRPRSRPEGGLEYPLVPGRFVQFCEEARTRTGISVLILDEINRANLARVFGELMYLLEYRDARTPLAGGSTFSIPENVRIIGTMNTADRSIALVDHALRRRFAFLAMRPNYDVLRRYHARHATGFPVEGLASVLARLNREINDPHYELGISYFLRPDLAIQIEDIWRMEIEPYLEEYFFDRPGRVDEFRWENVGGEING